MTALGIQSEDAGSACCKAWVTVSTAHVVAAELRPATLSISGSPQSINGAAAGRWHGQGLETTRAKPLVLISTEKD